LAGQAGLQILDLSCTGVKDVSPLAGLAGLQSLDLSGTGVTDLSPLASLPGFQKLDLRDVEVKDLSPLERLPALSVGAVATAGSHRGRYDISTPELALSGAGR
jgi:internalin A